MGSGAEQRASIRLSERCRVAYRVLVEDSDNPKRHAAETLNISASGVCIVSKEPLLPEGHVALELTLADAGRDRPVVAVGKVVWCDRDGDAFRVGICYTWLRDEDRRDLGTIADYVARRVAESAGAGETEATS